MFSSASEQAGYSGTPLARKLGIKENFTLALAGAPPGWSVPDLPLNVQILRTPLSVRSKVKQADVVVAFVTAASQLNRTALAMARNLAAESSIWIAWPRRAGGHTSDVTEQLIRDVLLPIGVVDVKVAALDHDWSGLKFVWRRENRGVTR